MSDFLGELRQELVDAHARHGQRGHAGQAARRWHPRGWRLADVLAPVAVAACVAVALAVSGVFAPGPAGSVRITKVARIGGQPTDAASGFGSLWVSDYERRLDQIDPRSGRVVQRIPLDDTAVSVTVDATGVWVASDGGSGDTSQLFRVDPKAGRVVAQATVPTHSATLAGTSAGPWLLSTHKTGGLWRVDPATAQTVAGTPTGSRGVVVAASPSAVWTIDFAGHVAQRDTATGRVLRDLGPVAIANSPVENVLVADATGAWLVGADGRGLVRVERGRVVRRIAVPIGDAPVLAVGGDSLWVASGDQVRRTYRLQRIDVGDGSVTARVDLGTHPPRALVPVRGGIDVVAGDGTVLLVRR